MRKAPTEQAVWTSGPRPRWLHGRLPLLALLVLMLGGLFVVAGVVWAARGAAPALPRAVPTAAKAAPALAAAALNAGDMLGGKPAAPAGPVGGEAPPSLPSPLPTTISPALATVLADLPATLPPALSHPGSAANSVSDAAAPVLGSDLVVGPPTLSVAMMDTVLECYQSPAAGLGARFYAAGQQYAIDPAYGLAWFIHESKGGVRGIAPTIKSIGNFHALPGAPNVQGFQAFGSWEESIDAWFARVSNDYVHEQGLRTVGQIMARYDGPDDPQDLPSIISDIETLVHAWRRAAAGLGPMPMDASPIVGIPPASIPTPPPAERASVLPKAAEITSEFGHYPDGGAHYGLDLRASSGVPQEAPVGGVVLEVHRGCVAWDAACGRGWGNHIWWRSAVTGHYILLAHYEQIDPAVQVGATIHAGQVLGLTGMTGYATGPHVHIQVNPEGLADTGAIQPSLEFPWMACGATTPQLGAWWGNEVCP